MNCPRSFSAVVLALALMSAPALGQGFDMPRYQALVEECTAFQQSARAALERGDSSMALVHIDLGRDACRQARGQLSDAGAALGEDDRARLVADQQARDLAWADLLIQLDACEEARDLLGASGRLSDSLDDDSARAFGAVAVRVLACLPVGGVGAARTVELGVDTPQVWLAGTTRGVEAASSRFGPDCTGMIPALTNYSLVVTDDGEVTVEATSEGGDLVLVVSGPSGTFCNDDFSGFDPHISTHLDAGTYQVFVGEYGGTSQGTEFSIGFRYAGPDGVVGTEPTFGRATLGPGMSAQELTGHTYGLETAEVRFGVGCRGFVPERPNHRLEVTEETTVSVRAVSLFEESPIALIIAGSDSMLCSEGPATTTPSVTGTLPAGIYDVYVTEELAPWGTGYVIRFAADEAGSADWTELTPLIGTATGPAPGQEVRLSGFTGGDSAMALAIEPACRGTIHEVPDAILEVSEPGVYGVMVVADLDTSLAVVGEGVVFCNDDWGGDDPGVFQHLEAGRYAIFVGSDAEAVSGSFELRIVRE